MSTVTTLIPITRGRDRATTRMRELRLLKGIESPALIPTRPTRETRPVSLLAEAERRIKACMQATSSLLQLDNEEGQDPATESALSEMESRLQAMAALEKARCRAGDFDRVDLAVYLRHATTLWNSPPRTPLPGGWTCDGFGSSMEWRLSRSDRGQDTTPLGPLGAALRTFPAHSQEDAGRAALATAILFPPWRVRWCAPPPACGLGSSSAQAASGISLRVQATDTDVVAQVKLSDRGPGLPSEFAASAQIELARDLENVLAQMVGGSSDDRASGHPRFEVVFVPSL